MQNNRRLAEVFHFLANALEWQGENVFKVRAYRLAADTLEGLTEPVEELIQREALRELPHIGEAVDKKVRQYLAEGTFPALQRVQYEIPKGIQELLMLPGMTGRAVLALQEKLHIEDTHGLRQALQDGTLLQQKWTPAVREAIEKTAQHIA